MKRMSDDDFAKQIGRAEKLNHELAEYAKAYTNAADDATRDAIEKQIDLLTDEYARDVFGLPEEEIARINAESEAAVDAEISEEIHDFIDKLGAGGTRRLLAEWRRGQRKMRGGGG